MLEREFDNHDSTFQTRPLSKPEGVEEIKLGIGEASKNVYIGGGLTPEIRKSLISLLRKYRHVFSWSYDDLKAYREYLFQHEIPLKENTKPFRQKLRPVNPMLAPKM